MFMTKQMCGLNNCWINVPQKMAIECRTAIACTNNYSQCFAAEASLLLDHQQIKCELVQLATKTRI